MYAYSKFYYNYIIYAHYLQWTSLHCWPWNLPRTDLSCSHCWHWLKESRGVCAGRERGREGGKERGRERGRERKRERKRESHSMCIYKQLPNITHLFRHEQWVCTRAWWRTCTKSVMCMCTCVHAKECSSYGMSNYRSQSSTFDHHHIHLQNRRQLFEINYLPNGITVNCFNTM